jgi:hypothetical protein
LLRKREEEKRKEKKRKERGKFCKNRGVILKTYRCDLYDHFLFDTR